MWFTGFSRLLHIVFISSGLLFIVLLCVIGAYSVHVQSLVHISRVNEPPGPGQFPNPNHGFPVITVVISRVGRRGH